MSENKSVNRMFLILVAAYLLVSLGIGKFSPVALPVWASLILSEGLILVPGLIYCRVKGISVGRLIPFRRMKFSVWVLVVVSTYLLYPLLIVLNALTMLFVESGTVELMNSTQNGNFIVGVLLMAVLPAFAEEFVFRGVLFGTYRKSKMLPAILLSAFLFGCMHMNFNQFLYAFVLGIYLAFLVEATGSILSSMLAHFTLNFTSVALSFLLKYVTQAPGVSGKEEIIGQTGKFLNTMDSNYLLLLMIGLLFWGIIAIGTTAGAVGVYIAISKLCGRWEHVKGMFRGGSRARIITIPILIAIALMVGIMIRSAVF